MKILKKAKHFNTRLYFLFSSWCNRDFEFYLCLNSVLSLFNKQIFNLISSKKANNRTLNMRRIYGSWQNPTRFHFVWLSQIRGDAVVFTRFPPRDSDSTNERMTPSGEAEWPRRALLCPASSNDVAVTMHRLIENDVPRCEGKSANAWGMLRSLLKGWGTPNKKGVSFGEMVYRANWVRRSSFSLFPLVSSLPLVWYLINYENWTYILCRTFSAIRGKLPSSD